MELDVRGEAAGELDRVRFVPRAQLDRITRKKPGVTGIFLKSTTDIYFSLILFYLFCLLQPVTNKSPLAGMQQAWTSTLYGSD
jgi:hypothetical protein